VLAHVQIAARCTGQPLPVTLLLVPQWHGDPATPEVYLRWLRRMAEQGCQLALHGHTHRDEQPVKGPWQFLLRRCFTDGEGEFAALSHDEAQARLEAGRAWARTHALPLAGFVAPAWLLSEPAWHALRESGFDHTATLTHVVRLPDGARQRAPSLMFSSRSPWRRAASAMWLQVMAARHRAAPLLRLDLHPDDADHPRVLRAWTRWLRSVLPTRRAVLLRDALASTPAVSRMRQSERSVSSNAVTPAAAPTLAATRQRAASPSAAPARSGAARRACARR
jgi:predicted deacetylase